MAAKGEEEKAMEKLNSQPEPPVFIDQVLQFLLKLILAILGFTRG